MTQIEFTKFIPAPTSRLVSRLDIGDMYMDTGMLYLVIGKTNENYSRVYNLTGKYEIDIGKYGDKFVNVIRKIHITCEY